MVTQYTTLFSNSPILINSFSADNRCILWNGECQRLFGWNRDELNRFPDPLALFYPDLTIREKVRASVTTSPGEKMQEWYPIDKNGRVLTTLWSNILLPDHSILNIGVDITARKREEQRLARKAITDELTKCFNRAGVLAQLNDILLRNGQRVIQHGISVIMFDLDYFKRINDCWGHSAGDIALSCFGRELQARPLPGMVSGRLGGEEFLVILPEADSQQAWCFVEQFRQRLTNTQVIPGYQELRISFSAGILSLRTGDVMSANEVLKQVDEALYGAKRNGRGMSVIVGDTLAGRENRNKLRIILIFLV
ncbi:sensor domain-containing diguanylate cyclase [Mangrovibacter sp. SLW1]